MAKLIQRYTGQGQLVFEGDESAAVNYRIEEFQEFVSDGLGGQLLHYAGRPKGTSDSRGRSPSLASDCFSPPRPAHTHLE
jgi:hypothetical protein